MNKFKINSNKPKLMLNDFKSRSSIRKEDIDVDKEILGISSANCETLTLNERSYDSVKQSRKLSRITANDSKENSASVDDINAKGGKDARKRERKPSRFHQSKIRIERTQSEIINRGNCQQSGLSGMRSSLERQLDGLVGLLRSQGGLQVGGDSFIIKKESFKQLLDYVILTASAKHREESQLTHASHPNLSYLTVWMDHLRNHLIASMRKDAVRQLELEPNVMEYFYRPDEYEFEVWGKKYQLQELSNSLAVLKRQMSEATVEQVQLTLELEMKRKEVKLLEVHKVSLLACVEGLKKREESLRHQVDGVGAQLQFRRQEKRKMLEFIELECKNRIIYTLSGDYKQIESDIYEYAVYLQSNQLASQIDYQPHPYHQIEELIQEEMRRVNRCLIQDPQKPQEAKNRLMRDFVLSAMEKYKKKDVQMGQLNDFKTKCIREFVSHMKRWLSNWSLKQEHLSNLRGQFAVDAKQIREQLQQLSDSHPALIPQIASAFARIEENYRMGNSFY